nr:probable cyclic nucleotide-gated ion channel 5 [Ipomoea batatas]
MVGGQSGWKIPSSPDDEYNRWAGENRFNIGYILGWMTWIPGFPHRKASVAANKCSFGVEGLKRAGPTTTGTSSSFKKGMRKGSEGLKSIGRSLGFGVSRAVFPEDLKASDKKIFDPQDKFLLLWNRLFVISCILGISVDPLFFYLPVFDDKKNCLGIDRKLAIIATTLRTVIDAFYLFHMALQFRTAYIAPSSRVFGRGELVIDPGQIAKRYLRTYFIIDFLAVLPLPQVVGALWYLLSVERYDTCWQKACHDNKTTCDTDFLYCGNEFMKGYDTWSNFSEKVLNESCTLVGDNPPFDFGIFESALSSGIVFSMKFLSKYCYCLWWGLQNLRFLSSRIWMRDCFDAICERLKPCLYIENTYIVREGDPVDEMLFIIRGRLESVTTDGGRSGVEAFALAADELKFVASQFRRLHSRQVQHTFRFYSQQWRTWAACFIQAAWRRYIKRKLMELQRKEEEAEELAKASSQASGGTYSIRATFLASKFAANALRGVHRNRNLKSARELVKLQKPPEPDFSADAD